MYRSILVTLDGSAFAERALPYARMIAESSQARVILLRVISPTEGGSDSAATDQTQQVRDAEAYLAEVSTRLGAVPVDRKVVVGVPGEVIVGEIARSAVDLIVMSTHGRSGLGRWVYGSVADEVMRRSPVPVLLVPAECQPTAWKDRAPRILVPLDGSELSEEALDPALELAKVLGAELRLLRVVEPYPAAYAYADPSAYIMIDPTPELEAARAYLDQVAVRLREKGAVVDVKEEFGFAVTTITDTARAQAVDLIAMSTHGSSGLRRLIMGSVATGVVQRAAVPILIVRPAAARETAQDSAAESTARGQNEHGQ